MDENALTYIKRHTRNNKKHNEFAKKVYTRNNGDLIKSLQPFLICTIVFVVIVSTARLFDSGLK